jgi:hypothetical protein
MKFEILLGSFLAWFLTIGICGAMYGCPRYAVWQQGMEGEAELRKSQYSKQVAVQEAKAKQESASLLADAEVARARGVAKANSIIGDSLKGNESYLKYLWIHELENTKDQIIYVPTETNLPVLEATRMKK